MLILINDAGRRFRVRAIHRGERYGLNACLTHDRDELLVELADVANGEFPPREEAFVARYLATAFLSRADDADLWLFGKNVAWRLAPDQVRQVREWLRAGCRE
jgi:hypothetical protein